VLDRPVLAGSVEALEDHEQRALALCAEPVQLGEALEARVWPKADRPGPHAWLD
jgi:hypothetical protein